MKPYSILLSFILCMIANILPSQTVTLTFSGEDSTTGLNVPLDSVVIRNETLNCDTTIYGDIPSITFNFAAGIDGAMKYGDSFSILSFNPNPFYGKTILFVSTDKPGSLSLDLFNGHGGSLAGFNERLSPGIHRLEISSSEPGLLILNVADEKQVRSVKLMNLECCVKNNKITHLDIIDQKVPQKTGSDPWFKFHPGNQLLFKGSATGYHEEIIVDSPVKNSYYIFELVAKPVQPTVLTAPASSIAQTSAVCGGTVTSDGGSPVTARGVCWSTAQNPSIPGNHTADGTGTGIFVSTINGLTAGTVYYVRAYAVNNTDTAYGNEINFPTLPGECAGLTINHVAGRVAPVSKTVTYGAVTNVAGEPSKCWITSNLGADHQAASVDDSTEASAGWYWQFSLKQGYKHDGRNRTPNTIWVDNINQDAGWISENDPCSSELGGGWRVPTSSELTNVDAAGSWSTWLDPWRSPLKMHAAGNLYHVDGSLVYRGSYGGYWSSTQSSLTKGWNLGFDSSGSVMGGNNDKTVGLTLRCIKD